MDQPVVPPPWELRHFRALVAVTDHQSFTRAAESLWISQSSLSRTIAQMERMAGLRLVVRDSGTARLTEAGAVLEPHARRILAAVEDAYATTTSRNPTLRVGFTWNALAEDTSSLITEFEVMHPGLSVRLIRCDDGPLAGLDDGRSDLALLRGTPPRGKVSHVVLRAEPRMAVLPSDHVLVDRSAVELADLENEPLVINVATGSTPRTLWGYRSSDAHVVEVHNIDEWVEAIASGRGIGVSASSTSTLHPHPRVVYRPLPDAPAVPVVLAWPRTHAHPLARDFVAMAQHIVGRGNGSTCGRCR
jgi:DNA-binding transcriptional LysR family regulator